jgi:hypothetical protein
MSSKKKKAKPLLTLKTFKMDLLHLQSKFFTRQIFFFGILERIEKLLKIKYDFR